MNKCMTLTSYPVEKQTQNSAKNMEYVFVVKLRTVINGDIFVTKGVSKPSIYLPTHTPHKVICPKIWHNKI